MCFNIFLVIIDYDLVYGLSFNKIGLGGSVANASEAKESIIKFTHNIYIGLSTSYFNRADIRSVKPTATTLTVN